jgi:hypothetical protein
MADNKSLKGGFTVQEIEQIATKYRFEVFFCTAFILAALFSKIFDIMGYSLLLTAIGGTLGMIFPAHVERILVQVLEFTFKQEKITQIIIGVVLLILAIIISPAIFFLIGAVGGKALHRDIVVQKGKFRSGSRDDEGSGHA